MRCSSLVGILGLAALVAAAEHATAQSKCADAKLKAAAKQAKCLGDLHAKGAKLGVAAPADKLQKCHDKLTEAFDKAESKPPCRSTGDEGVVDDAVADFSCDMAQRLAGIRVVSDPSAVGYVPLDLFGATPTPLGDEQIVNVDVLPTPGPATFIYDGVAYGSVGVSSNGYLVPGGATGTDFVPSLPNRAFPNHVIAPFWTDLDGTGAPGFYVARLTDGVSEWFVVEWRVNLFGTSSRRVFQVWLGLNGSEDVTFAYDPANLPPHPGAGYGLAVGAEDANGCRGAALPGAPGGTLRVSTIP